MSGALPSVPPHPRRPAAPFIPIVPAGGAGTRLWPLSRRSRPKFLLDLTGTGRSLLQQTLDRLAPLTPETPIIVTGVDHAGAVAEQVGESARILAEPSPRNSMPAIALAAAVAEREEPQAIIGSFAADHLIGDDDDAKFAAAVHSARAAAEAGFLVTIGITPDRPATGFGYIEQAPPGTDPVTEERLRGTGAEPVVRFVEKPDRERAEQFLQSGCFQWNAGMFIARASVLLDELAAQIPPLAAGVRRIATALEGPSGQEVLEEVWPTLTSIAIDHALAEPLAAAGRVAVVPADLEWDDVGDYAALAGQLRARPPVNADEQPEADDDLVVLGRTPVLSRGSRATVYGSTDRLVVLVGLDGVSVAQTDDVLLVLADDSAQDLAQVVAGLPEKGLGHLR
ncbi:MAG: mannose-1-phosphate guanylyltransferase [Brachybacterium sp.]|nr:mannose-1-phosphate guanylyltransferase [Brachybacterium sp.]